MPPQRSPLLSPSRLRHGIRLGLRGARDPASPAGLRRRLEQSQFSEAYTRQVLDLTIRLAEVMLSSGSGTADVVATARDVARAFRLDDCVVDITFNTIIVSAQPSEELQPVTLVRSVQTRSTDYSRLYRLDKLVRKITTGGVTVERAHQEMDDLAESPHPYPRWLATAAWAGFALGVAMLLGGSLVICLLAALTTAFIDRLGRLLVRIRLPFFFLQAIGAAAASVLAVLAYLLFDESPTTLVATGIVVLLSGLTLVGAMQDALTGYMVTATARLGDVIFMTAGIVVGILAVLQLSTLTGVVILIDVDPPTEFVPPSGAAAITLAVFGSALAGMCFVLASYAPLRSLPVAAFVAALAEVVLIALGSIGVGQAVASGAAAVVVGLAATLASIRRGAPALVIAMAGITPLLPGLAVFRAVFALAVDQNFSAGLGQMLTAVAVAVALGSGVVMGEFIGSPLRVGAGRLGEWLRVDGMPGLRRSVGVGVTLRSSEETDHPATLHEVSSGSVALVPVDPREETDDEEQPDDAPPDDDRPDQETSQ
jgi:uncharacterized membrane protein YjjP (DUF1212 family)